MRQVSLKPRVACYVGASSLRFAAIILLALVPVSLHVSAAENGSQPSDVGMVFKILPQPLGRALETYARVSSREVLYDGTLADDRRSSLVDGSYTPEVALQILLAGTGLTADFKDRNFFVVSQAPAETTTDAANMRSVDADRYYGILQAGLRSAFCTTHVLPDNHRVAARLWIGQQGGVLQARTLASSDSELNQKIGVVLRRIRLDKPPPPNFAQPVTIVIAPSKASRDCGGLLSPTVTAP